MMEMTLLDGVLASERVVNKHINNRGTRLRHEAHGDDEPVYEADARGSLVIA